MTTMVGVPGQSYKLLDGITLIADIDSGVVEATPQQVVALLQAGCTFAPPGPSVRAPDAKKSG